MGGRQSSTRQKFIKRIDPKFLKEDFRSFNSKSTDSGNKEPSVRL